MSSPTFSMFCVGVARQVSPSWALWFHHNSSSGKQHEGALQAGSSRHTSGTILCRISLFRYSINVILSSLFLPLCSFAYWIPKSTLKIWWLNDMNEYQYSTLDASLVSLSYCNFAYIVSWASLHIRNEAATWPRSIHAVTVNFFKVKCLCERMSASVCILMWQAWWSASALLCDERL